MSELKGQTTIFDHLKDELDGEPTASRALKLLDYAYEQGWELNPNASFVMRLTRDDALPFFIRYDLAFNVETGKRSWRFAGARAQNGQPLNYNDIKIYLEDPDVIHPEPPTSPEDDSDEAFRTALGSLDPLGPTAVPPAKNKPEPGFTDWGALLS
jgi:hypothetical protein